MFFQTSLMIEISKQSVVAPYRLIKNSFWRDEENLKHKKFGHEWTKESEKILSTSCSPEKYNVV